MYPKRTSQRQRQIIDLLRQSGGALNSYAFQRYFGRGFTNATLWRLVERGIIHMYDAAQGVWHSGKDVARYTPTAKEKAALKAAMNRNPRATAWWVLAEKWM